MALSFDRLNNLYKSFFQLGPGPSGLYALYHLGLRSGYFRWQTPGVLENSLEGADLADGPLESPHAVYLPSPDTFWTKLDAGERECILLEAGEVAEGKARLFGGEPVPLELASPLPLKHWTAYQGLEAHWMGERDVKFLWEPGRFGWVYPLARAYLLSHDERYPRRFWEFAESFWQANPPNLGPHWISAQEVALRMLALVFAAQVFSTSRETTPGRLRDLFRQVAWHAMRIPPTLIYARAQNNNHLLSEAAGLYSAGLILKDWHPAANHWRRLGWKWLVWGFLNQIQPDGTYVQHSTNYHRLMLQLGLWVAAITEHAGESLPAPVHERLAAAVRWFAGQVDPISGEMTNLGANDGAYIFPLASGNFRDARPVLQAAARRFLGKPYFPPGPWDEMSAWFIEPSAINSLPPNFPDRLGRTISHPPTVELHSTIEFFNQKSTIYNPQIQSWASLRSVHFYSRPSHADQLHVEIWWRGLNLARDAGTYLYNAPHPWDNRLAETEFHNTVTVDGRSQMTRAGRFLWLDWAQSRIRERATAPGGESEAVTAVQDGYRRSGVLHQRTLQRYGYAVWRVVDRLESVQIGSSRAYRIRLHWLLPDWEWEMEGHVLRIRSPYGWVEIETTLNQAQGETNKEIRLSVVRAGLALAGEGQVAPQAGWYSPTYGVKIPAISYSLDCASELPLQLETLWRLPES